LGSRHNPAEAGLFGTVPNTPPTSAQSSILHYRLKDAHHDVYDAFLI
jgi:hypothetical protein